MESRVATEEVTKPDIARIFSEMQKLEKKLDDKLEEFKSEIKMEFRKFYEGSQSGVSVNPTGKLNFNLITSKTTETIATMSDR